VITIVLAIDSDKFIKMLTSQLMFKLEKMKQLAIEDLKQELEATVYSTQPELYEWTYELLNSIDSTPIQIKGNIITFDIFFNEDLMNHTSLFGKTQGIPVDVSLLTNEGHHHKTKMAPKRLHQYPGYHYIEAAMKRIKSDLEKYIGNIARIEVKKLTSKWRY
jgi:hypothetical protein